MAHVAESKKKIVKEMTDLAKKYSILALVNMENLPAPQLQTMRSELRGKIEIYMTKKRLMKIALESLKDEKKGIEIIAQHFQGMPALIFTNENPFKLSKMLQKSKASAPAKPGQIAPDDIVVKKGPTPFAPGPVISELSSIGLKVGVEGGKVAVKEDTVVAKKGEKIKPKVAEILTRLDIKPMEVGLGLVAAYEDGLIYTKDVLEVDEQAFNDKINLAALQAFNLAFNVTYITKDNAVPLISKAFNDAKALGVAQKIFDKGIVEDLLSKAEMEMLSLKGTANITAEEKPKEEVKVAKEEPKVEVKEEKKEVKADIKPEVKEEKIKIKEPEKKIEEKKPLVKKEIELEEKQTEVKPQEQVKEEVKVQEQPVQEVKEEPEIGAKGAEDIYEKESREELLAEGEISPTEEGFMQGYEEAGKTEEEKKQEEKPEETAPKKDDVDKKVEKMVERTKEFIEGTEETAADILEDVEKGKIEEEEPEQEPKKEPKPEIKEKPKPEQKQELKEESKEDMEKDEQERKEIEDLTKELIKKGTLRK